MPSLTTSPILYALTLNVRIMTTSQGAELLGTENRRRTQALLNRMEEASLIERVGGCMMPQQTSLVPLFQWQASEPSEPPNFEAIAYELKRRRFDTGPLDSIWRATATGFRTMRLPNTKRPARRSDWEHDVGLTQAWLSLRQEIETQGTRWILEDDFNQECLDSSCKPDAIIETADGQVEYIEYGGCYSADTLRKKFDSWFYLNWRLF